MREPLSEPFRHTYPGMVVLVTARWEGKQNILTAGWHSFISIDPPIMGVAVGLERYTHHLIQRSGVYGVHFLPAERAKMIQTIGTTSGAEIDKFSAHGLGYTEGLTVDVPILTEAYVAYECKVIDGRTYGDHDWFVGLITQSYRDNALFLEDGLPDINRLQIPLYLGRSEYAVLDATVRRERHLQ